MRLSFRYKIQIIVVALLSLTLFAYVSFASKFIEKDRLASLVEATANQGALLENKLSKRLASVKFWISQVMESPDKERLRKFQENSDLLGFAIREGGHITWVYLKNPDQIPSLPDNVAPGNTFIPLPKMKAFALAARTPDDVQNFSFWSARMLDSLAQDESIFMVVPQDGPPYINGEITLTPEMLIDFQTKARTKKMEGIERALNKEDYFLSVTPLESYPATIIFGYPKKVALTPVVELRWMSLSFAIFALSVTAFLSFLIGRVLTTQLQHLTQETARIASGNLDAGVVISSNDEVGDLSKSISVMSSSLKRLLTEVAEKGRMESELKTAQIVQETLIPGDSFKEGSVEVHGRLKTATECGGDFWFHWRIENMLFFIIADATGHGAAAALTTSAARSTIAGLKFNKETRLENVVLHLHTAVGETSRSQIMMTAFIGQLDLNSGELIYCDCSHERPFLLGPSRSPGETLKGPKSPRLGDAYARSTDFKISNLRLQSGDILFLYTDGIIDGKDKTGTPYSARRLNKFLLNAVQNKSRPQEILDAVFSLTTESSIEPSIDDMTAMIVTNLS